MQDAVKLNEQAICFALSDLVEAAAAQQTSLMALTFPDTPQPAVKRLVQLVFQLPLTMMEAGRPALPWKGSATVAP